MPADGEPYWTDDDRAYALAWTALRADVCGGCGHPRSESMDPANEFRYTSEALSCHACATAARAAKEFDPESSAGLSISTRLKD